MNTVALDKVPYVDFPELKFNVHESTQMPFRYITDKEGNPIMPQVSSFMSHYIPS
jgi:ribosome biogenesis SPOUT family RNA methylase Rps3